MDPHGSARKLLDRIEDLRVFPPAAGRVLHVAQNPRSSLRDLEGAVGSDPVLAGKVVELANSAMYGRGHRVDDLWRAIQLLGFEITRDTALALALSSIGQRADQRWAHLWQHATWSAQAARSLTPFVDREVGRSAFLCALLHDIGRQLMGVIDPDALDAVFSAEQGGHPDVMAVERRAFGVDHAALGAACLDRWSFRPQVARAVARHHQPIGLLVEPTEIQRVALLQLSDTLAHAMEVTDQVVGVVTYTASEPARRVLGVHRADLEAIAAELLQERQGSGRFAA